MQKYINKCGYYMIFYRQSSIPLWRIPRGHVGPVRSESQRSSPSPSPSPNSESQVTYKIKNEKIKTLYICQGSK